MDGAHGPRRRAACDGTSAGLLRQNLLTAFGEDIRTRSQLRLAAGQGKVSFVDVRDVAAVAAQLLTHPQSSWPNALTLTGPQALTFGEAAGVPRSGCV